MRASNVFVTKLLHNKRIKVDKDQELELRRSNADFWHTVDVINHRARFDTVLENQYSIQEYQAIEELMPLFFPSEVTIMPGVRYEDYLDRKFCFYETDAAIAEYSPKLLRPEEFKEAFIFLVSVMKVTLKAESFKALKVEPKTLATGEYYQYNGHTDTTINVSIFPIPVKIQVLTERNNLMAVDEDYISEWLTNNVFAKLLTRS